MRQFKITCRSYLWLVLHFYGAALIRQIADCAFSQEGPQIHTSPVWISVITRDPGQFHVLEALSKLKNGKRQK